MYYASNYDYVCYHQDQSLIVASYGIQDMGLLRNNRWQDEKDYAEQQGGRLLYREEL